VHALTLAHLYNPCTRQQGSGQREGRKIRTVKNKNKKKIKKSNKGLVRGRGGRSPNNW
jgi:hypothetical protein